MLALVPAHGCAYKFGSGLVRGALEEAGGQGQSDGVEEVGDLMLERALLAELGHQLGAGLSSGVSDVTPEQQEALQRTIDGILASATRRLGKGVRDEVSPELRSLINQSIVQTLSEGLRGELGSSMEETVDRVVTKAVVALRTNIDDPATRIVVADMLRDAIYFAMREGQGGTPAIGDTLRFTIEEDVLDPLSNTVGGLSEGVALQVNKSAERTEQLLRAIIGGLVIVIGLFLIAYVVRGRRLRRVEDTKIRTEALAVMDNIDDDTREFLGALHQHRRDVDPTPEPAREPDKSTSGGTTRRDDYTRD